MPRRDPLTGLTDAELAALAEEAYAERDDADAWEAEEPPDVSLDVRSVVSVRFNRGELGPIERAAIAAGVPVSMFSRNAVINTESLRISRRGRNESDEQSPDRERQTSAG